MWILLLKNKSEAFCKFKNFKTITEQETRASIKTFRTDRGGEFVSHKFDLYCNENGISRHLTTPYSPQQNGVVERRNQTLFEMTRSILKHMNVPSLLWGEATRHATYLINQIATRSLTGETPYEALRNKKPNLKHLRVFGCVCYARTESARRKKLDDRSGVVVHLGIESGSKAYRLLDLVGKRIVVSCDVIFDEDKRWTWNGDDASVGTNMNSATNTNSTNSFSIHVRGFENDERSREAQVVNENESIVKISDKEKTEEEVLENVKKKKHS